MFLFAPVRWAFKLVSLAITAAVIYVSSGVQVVAATTNSVNATPTAQQVDAIVVTDHRVLNWFNARRRLPGATERGRSLSTARSRMRPVIVAGPSLANSSSDRLRWRTMARAERVVGRKRQYRERPRTRGVQRRAAGDGLEPQRDHRHRRRSTRCGQKRRVEAGIVPTVAVPTSSEKVVFAEITPLWHEATGDRCREAHRIRPCTWAAS